MDSLLLPALSVDRFFHLGYGLLQFLKVLTGRRYHVAGRTGHPVGTGGSLDFSVVTPLVPGEDSTFGKIPRWYRGSTRYLEKSFVGTEGGLDISRNLTCSPGETVKAREKSRDPPV